MKRRIFTGLAAASAVAAAVLINSGASASAADAPPALSATSAAGQSAGITPNAKLPATIQVDATQNHVVATFRGVGKQVYDCTGGAWTFREPVAGLFTTNGIPAAIHGKGPFWAGFDGSHVDGSGAVPAPAPDPAKNVPWLRLVGAPTPNTTGVFSNVAFIQRIDTRGGVAPTGTCSAPNTKAVDYTANYVFWARN